MCVSLLWLFIEQWMSIYMTWMNKVVMKSGVWRSFLSPASSANKQILSAAYFLCIIKDICGESSLLEWADNNHFATLLPRLVFIICTHLWSHDVANAELQTILWLLRRCLFVISWCFASCGLQLVLDSLAVCISALNFSLFFCLPLFLCLSSILVSFPLAESHARVSYAVRFHL